MKLKDDTDDIKTCSKFGILTDGVLISYQSSLGKSYQYWLLKLF